MAVWRSLKLWIGLALCAVARARAQDAPSPSVAPSPAVPAIQEVRPGIFRIGQVTLDKARREVRFPAFINQREGLVEYLLVGTQGKTHESVLRTDVRPFYLHTAMLLLGAKTGGEPAGATLPPPALDSAYLATAPLPAGVPVTISLQWKLPGKDPVIQEAETLITNTKTGAPMTAGNWIYNGSLFDHGQFMADQEFSIAAVVTDPVALINNPRPGHENDSIWSIATDRMPPIDTPVEVRLTCVENIR